MPNISFILSIIIYLFTDVLESKNINNVIDIITGAAGGKYYMMDYFPFFKWFPYVLLGIWSGKYIIINIKDIQFKTFLSYIGKNSLFLYVIHILILMFIYN